MFRLLGVLVTLVNLLLWLRFRKQLVTAFPRHAKWLRWASVVGFLLFFHSWLLLAIGGFSGVRVLRTVLPDWFVMASMAVQFAAWLCLLPLAVVSLVRLFRGGVRLLQRRLRQRSGPAPQAAAPAAVVNDERRRFLASAGLAVPALALGISGAGVAQSRQVPVVVRVRVPVRRELTELHGLRIAQLSDIHVGSYMDAERLDEIRTAINAIGADFHVITGDLLDNDVSQLELSARLLRDLRPRRGQIFLSMGNHEYIAARSADTRTIIQGLEAAGGQMLIDEAREVRVGAHRLWLAGIDYPPSPRLGLTRTTADSFDAALRHMRDDGAPRIVLSHHPRTFVYARDLPIDLMLSGHTHGGQIKLARFGDHAVTPILPFDFYHNGTYQHRGRQLHVNAGAGGWLPVRINCPPEITLVELVPA
jgi:hypothetical protein